jgi:hypothetical protein
MTIHVVVLLEIMTILKCQPSTLVVSILGIRTRTRHAMHFHIIFNIMMTAVYGNYHKYHTLKCVEAIIVAIMIEW